MKRYLFLLLAVAMLQACSTRQSVEFEVYNPTDNARINEMVEIDFALVMQRLSLAENELVVVYDEDKNEIPYQITFDNKLIFMTDVEPKATMKYRIEVGTPKEYETYAVGAVYPNRKDDVAWENDCVAFRAYGPALQESGEQAYGYDVWVKSVSHPVVAERYAKELNPETLAEIERLKAEDPEAAQALYNSVSYHNDHGNGLDYYKVGPTLGAGASALVDANGNIVYPYCYEQCEILDNGPLRFTMSLRYRPFLFGNDSVVETRVISLDKGSQLNRIDVVYHNLSVEATMATGIALHDVDGDMEYNKNMGYAAYADPADPVNGQTYVGMVYGAPVMVAEPLYFGDKEREARGAEGLLIMERVYTPGEKVTYYAGAGWSKWGFETPEDWFVYIEYFAKKLSQPLVVTIK